MYISYYDDIHDYHGKKVKFSKPMVYAVNLNEIYSEDKEIDKYGRFLLDERSFNDLSGIYFKTKEKKFEKIKSGMEFIVVKSYRIVPWGLAKAFRPELRKLVLKDENGLLSICAEYMIKEENIDK